ncbi:MAG: hypothetical protein OFPI_43900 [Osedax symbiont Rs2]|nr:MAG: hypothetical protein OFPI_43900 [Osedax symbiont Rs2]
MDITVMLLTLAGIAALGVMSPGPDFIAVTHAAVSSSKKQAGAVAAGVVLGNGIWAAAALFGVGTLFILFPTLFIAFKVIGGSYLIFMGYRMLRQAKTPMSSTTAKSAPGLLASFVKGFSATIANPKAAIFYASALTAVAPLDASYGLLSLMVLVVLCVATVWFACVVLFLSTPKASAFYKNIKVYLESVFGSLIMFFGINQILSR